MPLDTSKLVWLDLCSGLGGASQPALDRGWKVIRVDIDPRFKPDIVADARALPFGEKRVNVGGHFWEAPFRIDVLWASPPCQDYSKHQLRCFFPNPPEPDITIAQGVKSAIDALMPRAWFVENVWAARPWLNRIFGPLTNRIPGHAIWSNTLILLPNIAPHKDSFHAKHTSGKRWGAVAHTREGWWKERIAKGFSYIGTGHNGLEAAEAAKIPYEIGEAICRAVEARVADAA